MFTNSITPALLDRPDRVDAIRKRLEQAEEDVRLERDQTREKQRFLDMNDWLHEETATRVAEASTAGEDAEQSKESDAVAKWTVAVILLGSGAERLEANVKRELIGRIVHLGELIIESWTRTHSEVDFQAIKAQIQQRIHAQNEFASAELKSAVSDVANTIVDLFEYGFMIQPLMSVMTFLGEEARYNVLIESIRNTKIDGKIQTLIADIWLADIDPAAGRTRLRKSVRDLPKFFFIRHAVAGQLLSRVYWKHWEKAGRLTLLQIANESLKGVGRQYPEAKIKEIRELLSNTRSEDDAEPEGRIS